LHVAHRPLRAPTVAHSGVAADFAAQRAAAEAAVSQPTHWFDSQSGAVGSVQSESALHSTHDPGDPTQKRDVPVPEHGAELPHWQPRSAHEFATTALHATPHAVHWVALTAAHEATPLRSQHSELSSQPSESAGLQAPHWPFWVPLSTQTAAPPGLAAHR
jgi:hypothetical protein